MKKITELGIVREKRPIRVVQFGEGNFLRAFADYMIDIANEQGRFHGNIAILKPIDAGSLALFQQQQNLYTVLLQGLENGKVVCKSRVITSVSQVLSCKEDFSGMMALARLETLRFIISNTTEAGIVLDRNDRFNGLPNTYPGKLTKFLYERYKTFPGDRSKGLILLPVELIEENGNKLKECVLALADVWALPADFKTWLNDACIFCNTLVDRIVTGYPGSEAPKLWHDLGYEDRLLDVAEPFARWVIESKQDIQQELPFHEIGLPVIFTKNLKPYRECKVRILNGAHTSIFSIAYLYGLNYVRDCMNDARMYHFIQYTVKHEIAPFVPLPSAEILDFVHSVFERFKNPFINHELLSIALNSFSKWKTRVLPSFRDYYSKFGKIPLMLTFSFAALLAFYRGTDLRPDGIHQHRADGTAYTVRDDAAVLQFVAENSNKTGAEFVNAMAKNLQFWGEDLSKYPNFCEKVTAYLQAITDNAANALQLLLEEEADENH